MDEKIFDELSKINTQICNMNQKIDELDKKIDKVDQKIDFKIAEVNLKIEELEERIINKFLIFEHEYGYKIDTILDSIVVERDKNIEKSDQIRHLDERMDHQERRLLAVEEKLFKSM